MARQREFTDAFIQSEFYKRFYRMTAFEQTGIIRGLETVRACKGEAQADDDSPPFDLIEPEPEPGQ